MDQIIQALKVNPIFRMSLGSKELFHSNFLEYLWDVDQNAFKELINAFLPGTFVPGIDYLFGREKKNFDICIYHKVGGNKDFFDLIIENKVKSIPYKAQLDEYYNNAISNNCNCRFVLLTLSDQFPDVTNIKTKWNIVRYDQLRAEIDNRYFQKTNKCSNKDKDYIKDYCDFINQLNALLGKIIPINITSPLFVQNDIDRFKDIRLHDLYIKLRCSWFVIELKKQITHNTNMVHKFNEIQQNVVNLNVDLNQGNGQIAAWICDNNDNVFEVVIQGNQYRHGINQRTISTYPKKDNERLNELYYRLGTLCDTRPLEFLNFVGYTNTVQPKTIKKFRGKNTSLMKIGPFNCYGEDYIYKYIPVDNLSVNDLLNMMRKDINNIFTNIPSLY